MKKKTITVILLAFIMTFALAACGGGGGSSVGELSTLADVYAIEAQDFQETFDPEYYACVFGVDGTYTRCEAAMPEGLYDQIDAIPWDDERDAAVKELLGSVEITKQEDVTYLVPDEDSAKALIGKQGKDLEGEGFELQYLTVNDGQIIVSGVKDYGYYSINFGEGDIDEEDEAWKEKIADMTITDAQYLGFDYSILEQGFEGQESAE